MRFLCLHGFGTNNQIFKMQTTALRYELTNHDEHSFEFVQGVFPVSKPAELGSLSDFEEGHFGYYDPESPSSALAALDQLDAFIRSHGPFDGVIGFSHGAQLAASYIVHKKLEGLASVSPFKCAILFSPLGVYDSKEWLASGLVQKLDIKDNGCAIDIPTLLVWGITDPWKEEAHGVSLLCNPQTTYTFVHSGGHEIPGIGLNEALGPVTKLAKRCIISACTEAV
ncbi:DUF341 domain protein [Paraphaeosphaeria sporulosa]|uniref:DUF341 domain protein n=1 Tax=Paraphaeosphaeria sporulosa TaxID=1460663 RepID=A0A177CYZ9_9PLEO|nr:DUF341 domain protein [Paraphaeosphaeria sporulosa]OAG12506.1 DUF341 domain protein [Paraphaeosphaeria sporulosa]